MESRTHSHFKGMEAIDHVAEVYTQGVLNSAELHGMETPGKISAAGDALRDCSITLLLLWFLLHHLAVSLTEQLTLFIIFGFSLLVWRAGRSGWLGWSRLERLHRLLAQEKWEIEHHRQQERMELAVLYAAKGFEGKLLEEVLDVLMADGDRLLKVMLQEELGLSLETHDHPLLQALGAASGAFCALAAGFLGYWLAPDWGMLLASLLTLFAGTFLATYRIENRLIPALIWNGGLLALSFGSFYFLIDYFFPK